MELLEEQIAAAHSAHEMQIESLQAQLQREQLERSMAEGALETARKDVSRLQQEVGALRSRIIADGGGEARQPRQIASREQPRPGLAGSRPPPGNRRRLFHFPVSDASTG